MSGFNPSSTIKIALALIIDLVTMIMIFPIWLLTDASLFPYAFASIMIALVFLNMTLIGSKKIIETYSIATFYAIASVSLIYYGATMIFTGLSHTDMSAAWYTVYSLVFLALYIGVVAGLRKSGTSHMAMVSNQDNQAHKTLVMKTTFIEIKEAMETLSSASTPEAYDEMVKAYKETKERLEASTPFGRSQKLHIGEFENKVEAMIMALKTDLCSADGSKDVSEVMGQATKALKAIKEKIIDREKMFIH